MCYQNISLLWPLQNLLFGFSDIFDFPFWFQEIFVLFCFFASLENQATKHNL